MRAEHIRYQHIADIPQYPRNQRRGCNTSYLFIKSIFIHILTIIQNLLYNTLLKNIQEENKQMTKLKHGRHTSAKKEERKTARRTGRNKELKEKIKSAAKLLRKSVEKKDIEKSKSALKEACSLIDKAVKNNIMHKNAAAHKKSGIARLVNTLSAKP